MISSYSVPAVPVCQQCGGVLLLIWDAHCAACHLVHHLNISFCLRNCFNKWSTLVMRAPSLVITWAVFIHAKDSGSLCHWQCYHCLFNGLCLMRTSL
jgi:hypothetical protein